MASRQSDSIIRLKDISLSYGDVQALANVSLNLYPSYVNAVVGEHGAGKSTMAHVLAGAIKPDCGTVNLVGRDMDSYSIKIAKKHGIEIVRQEHLLFEHMTIAENLFCKNQKVFGNVFFSKKKLMEEAEAYLERFGLNFNPAALMSSLDLPGRTIIDIIRHIHVKPRLLILDEALEKISAVDLQKIMPFLRRLKDDGLSILFITHRIDDIYDFADEITIMRKGRIIITDSIRNIDKVNLIKLAYTQIARQESLSDIDREFYQLLKYNEAILEGLPINVIVVDTERKIKIMNKCAKDFFRLEHSINLFIDDLLGNDNLTLLHSLYESIEKRENETFLNVTLDIEGQEVIVTIITYPIYDGAHYIGNMIIVQDVTKHEKLREKVVFTDQLASVGLLAAGVAHEINNPLEILFNYLDFLRSRTSDNDSLEILRQIESASNAIEQIVTHLITFSDDNSHEVEAVDINEVLKDLVALLRFNARKKNIEISFSPGEEELFVRVNRTEMKQLYLNLVKNSFEALPEGGCIDIRTCFFLKNDYGYARIDITDTGSGIRIEKMQNIFMPFFSTKDQKQGNRGLGLSISYGIIKKYKGDISVKNLDDGGCRFTVILPQESV